MSTVDVLDAQGSKTGTAELPAELFDVTANIPLIHQVVVGSSTVNWYTSVSALSASLLTACWHWGYALRSDSGYSPAPVRDQLKFQGNAQ